MLRRALAWLRGLPDALRRLLGMRLPAVPREPAVIRPIGVVRNSVREPRPDGWEHVRSDLIFLDELDGALDGIEDYSHVIVVFAYHAVPEEARTTGRLHPRGDAALPEQGVLATRSQLRPGGIGVSVAQLQRRRHNVLRVLGLDAIDGTPVLDIKPYFPGYDAAPDARVPEWARRLSQRPPGT
jgi:tRNA-Thr(GGU) m(6)t(6)A37 methyltransferase TsaA